jgi:hypothetical protein
MANLEPAPVLSGPKAKMGLLAGNVQDRVGLSKILLKRLDRIYRRQYDQIDFAAIGFALHSRHASIFDLSLLAL